MSNEVDKERSLLLLAMVPGVWLAITMPVFAQESYYWTYSQHPALSYFDHPPMVAWMIWLGTNLLGDGALGIRLLTVLCGAAVIWVGSRILREFGGNPQSRRAWLWMSGCAPILIGTRFLANPDPPLALFWICCLLALWKARSGSLGWWVVAGGAAGCALLSKYTAAFLAVGGVLVLCFDPAMRRQLRRPGPYLGVLVATLTFLPVLVWNWRNDFESFRFQTEGRWERAEWSLHWFGQFAGLQFGVFNPVLALLLPGALLWLWRRARGRDAAADPRALWLLAFGLPLPLFFLANSLIVQVKVNWLVPAYLPLLLGLAWWWGEGGFVERRPVLSRRACLVAMAFLAVVPLAPLIQLVPQSRGSSWTGWSEIAASAEKWEETVDGEDQVEGNVFFVAADYKDAAQLTRNLKLLDGKASLAHVVEPTLAQNVLGRPALQFDHWNAPGSHVGQDAIFVLPRPEQRQEMLDLARMHFASVQEVEELVVRRLGIEVLTAKVMVCRAYRGQ